MTRRFMSNLAMAVIALAALVAVIACERATAGSEKFAGNYIDEFGNTFVLNDDYTATIQFAGQKEINHTQWFDGTEHNSAFATIEYNGDPMYYFMRDGNLYRHREDMEKGRAAIKLTRQD